MYIKRCFINEVSQMPSRIDHIANNIYFTNQFNLWHSDDKEVHIMVNPEKLIYLQNVTRSYQLPSQVMASNVQRYVEYVNNM